MYSLAVFFAAVSSLYLNEKFWKYNKTEIVYDDKNRKFEMPFLSKWNICNIQYWMHTMLEEMSRLFAFVIAIFHVIPAVGLCQPLMLPILSTYDPILCSFYSLFLPFTPSLSLGCSFRFNSLPSNNAVTSFFYTIFPSKPFSMNGIYSIYFETLSSKKNERDDFILNDCNVTHRYYYIKTLCAFYPYIYADCRSICHHNWKCDYMCWLHMFVFHLVFWHAYAVGRNEHADAKKNMLY